MIRCPYCNNPAKRKKGRVIYPNRKDLSKKNFWVCKPCDARVGCHGKTCTPLGALANAELRRARNKAHAAMDPIWKSGRMSRSECYGWVANRLGIDPAKCHMAKMGVEDCLRVAELCAKAEGKQ